jgi:D-amino-acid dehydrogenase
LPGLKRPPNYGRADAMLQKGQSVLSRPPTRRGPAMDGLPPHRCPTACPAIGRSRASPADRLCFRPRPSRPHTVRRYRQARRRARDRGKTSIDLTPFSPQRF